MFSSGSWFHIAFGFILGIFTTIFIITVARLLKKRGSFGNLVGVSFLFSLSVTFLFYFYVSAIFGGILVEWKFLGLPAFGEPAVRVLDIGYVETKSGNIYHSICIDCQDKNWELVNEVPESQEEVHTLSTSDCGTLPFLPLQQYDFIDSNSMCKSVMWGTTKVSYAIDDRGHVYSWLHTYYPGDIVMPWYIENSSYIAVAIFSSIFGASVILLLALFNYLGSRVRKDNVKTV
jgi:hypothetical protein